MTETPDLKRRSILLGRFADAREPAGPPLAVIGQSCFALRGVACMSCRDVCPTSAVRFELALGGARPRIMAEACTGCGDCSRGCPGDAIQMSEPEPVS